MKKLILVGLFLLTKVCYAENGKGGGSGYPPSEVYYLTPGSSLRTVQNEPDQIGFVTYEKYKELLDLANKIVKEDNKCREAIDKIKKKLTEMKIK